MEDRRIEIKQLTSGQVASFTSQSSSRLDLVERKASVKHFLETVFDMASLQLAAGHDPDQVMLTVWTMVEAWCRVNIDGSWPVQTEPKSV